MFKRILSFSFLIFISLNVFGQKKWQDIHSSKDLFESYSGLIYTIFNQYDLNYTGVENVKSAEWENQLQLKK